MKILKRTALRLKKQNWIIANNKSEVERSNQKLAFSILLMGCGLFLVFIVASLILDSHKTLTVPYVIEFSILVLLLFLFRKLKKYISSANLIYAAYATLIGYSIYTSAFITPDSISVIILFVLFQIPIITLDKNWRINAVVIAYAAVYMIIVLPLKDPDLVTDEILNCFLFTVFGIGFGHILRFTRLENLELKRQALIREKTDYLTGLKNRRSLFERLIKIESGKGMGGLKIGVIMIDLDWFKRYNDTYGHQAGDECLEKLAACLNSFEEEYHIQFYRYGGEEFAGVSTGYSGKELLAICRQLNERIYAMRIPHSANSNGFVTVSIGFAVIEEPSKTRNERHLLSQADVALYAAKTRGRNCTVQYEEGMIMEDLSEAPQKRPSFRTRV